ncbi:MAG: MBL fold metallo-hydrolase [Candidatus Heimdallarchaeota archaeon]|nr:MBL fold metallo-hydrolase [Candidatus Heimdallarchaeota archaeon]
MVFEKINEHIYLTRDESFYDVVSGAIVLPTQLVMIDTGIHLGKMKEFREWVEKETGKQFKVLFITHFHGDHTFGNQIFSDCRIISPTIQSDYLKMLKDYLTDENIAKEQSRLEDPKALEGFEMTIATETFLDRFELIDGDVQVIVKHVGGHTNDSTYIYCPTFRALFAGDNLFVDSHPYGGHSSCNPDVWMDVYKEFLSLDVEIIIPGHGPVTNKSYVEKSLTNLELIKKTMKELVKEGKSDDETKEIIFQRYFPSKELGKPEDNDLNKSTVKRWFDVWIKGVE